MAIKISEWERPLLSLAKQARMTDGLAPIPQQADEEVLALAYDFCEELTAINSRSFSTASHFLPKPKRRTVRALYAFCRSTDDIVDRPAKGRASAVQLRAALDAWRTRSLTTVVEANDPIVAAWTDARLRHRIPQSFAEQLFLGVARDIDVSRYETFEELTAYCYGVAATVGFMCMYIIGFASDDAFPYALKLGVALQLTNILRDVGEDWRAGRLYLPLEDLHHFGLKERDVDAGIVDDRWREFMRFQIDRTRRLYREAWPGISLLSADGHFAIAIAADLYRAILADIEAHDYDVFSRRAYVSTWSKLKRLPAVWWRVKVLRPPRPNGAGS